MDIEIKNIKRYTSYCPTQWEGVTANGEEVYIRYRWGFLRVDINGKEVFGDQIGGEMDGVLSDEKMKEATKDKINWI